MDMGPSHSVIWAMPSSGSRTWADREVEGDVPRGFSRNSWTYDAKRDRLLFVMARTEFVYSPCCTTLVTMELWSLPLAEPYRWQKIEVPGPSPHWRTHGAVALDEVGDRLLLLGGGFYANGTDTILGDLWQLDLSGTPAWSEVVPAGGTLPGGRVEGVLGVDPVTNRLIVAGGGDSLGVFGDQISILDLTSLDAWVQHPAPATAPVFSYGSSRVFDRTHRQFLFADRYGIESPDDSVRVWRVDVSAAEPVWQRLEVEGGPPLLRDGPLLAVDEDRNVLQLFGGDGYDFEYRSRRWLDLWELSLGGTPDWSRIAGGSRSLYYTAYVPAIWDANRRRAVLVGGRGFGPSQTLSFDVSGAIPEWSFLADSYTGVPPTREGSVAAYDPDFDRMLLFGGEVEDIELGDLWQLDFKASPTSAWTRLLPEGEIPSPRTKATAIYDPVRKRMIVFGGWAGKPLDDIWALSLGPNPAWTRITPCGMIPPARFGHSAVYDSRRDAMIVFGGYVRPAPPTGGLPVVLQDVWVLSFGNCDSWFPLAIEGPPFSRAEHAALYDPVRDRMLVLWGRDRAAFRSDSKVLELAGVPHWREFLPEGTGPGPRRGAAIVYDALVDQALLLSGQGNDDFLTPDWALVWGTPGAVPPSGVPGPPLRLLGMAPNPTRGAVDVAFEVPQKTTVRVRIYDARGRLVRDMGAQSYEPGRHITCWDGTSDQGAQPASGVYFARLSLGTQEYKGKIVLMR
jgi:hypothetical protein